MSQSYNIYVNGSAAEKVKYDVYEENKVLKEKKKYKTNRIVKLKAVFMCIILFGGLFLLIYRYAMITEINNNIIKAEKDYTKLSNENSITRVVIDKQLDINNIKEIAETRLGMQKPDRSQVIYLDIPRTDTTVVLDIDGNSPHGGGSFATIVDKLGRFVRLLY